MRVGEFCTGTTSTPSSNCRAKSSTLGREEDKPAASSVFPTCGPQIGFSICVATAIPGDVRFPVWRVGVRLRPTGTPELCGTPLRVLRKSHTGTRRVRTHCPCGYRLPAPPHRENAQSRDRPGKRAEREETPFAPMLLGASQTHSGTSAFTATGWNDLHYTIAAKRTAREGMSGNG